MTTRNALANIITRPLFNIPDKIINNYIIDSSKNENLNKILGIRFQKSGKPIIQQQVSLDQLTKYEIILHYHDHIKKDNRIESRNNSTLTNTDGIRYIFNELEMISITPKGSGETRTLKGISSLISSYVLSTADDSSRRKLLAKQEETMYFNNKPYKKRYVSELIENIYTFIVLNEANVAKKTELAQNTEYLNEYFNVYAGFFYKIAEKIGRIFKEIDIGKSRLFELLNTKNKSNSNATTKNVDVNRLSEFVNILGSARKEFETKESEINAKIEVYQAKRQLELSSISQQNLPANNISITNLDQQKLNVHKAMDSLLEQIQVISQSPTGVQNQSTSMLINPQRAEENERVAREQAQLERQRLQLERTRFQQAQLERQRLQQAQAERRTAEAAQLERRREKRAAESSAQAMRAQTISSQVKKACSGISEDVINKTTLWTADEIISELNIELELRQTEAASLIPRISRAYYEADRFLSKYDHPKISKTLKDEIKKMLDTKIGNIKVLIDNINRLKEPERIKISAELKQEYNATVCYDHLCKNVVLILFEITDINIENYHYLKSLLDHINQVNILSDIVPTDFEFFSTLCNKLTANIDSIFTIPINGDTNAIIKTDFLLHAMLDEFNIYAYMMISNMCIDDCSLQSEFMNKKLCDLEYLQTDFERFANAKKLGRYTDSFRETKNTIHLDITNLNDMIKKLSICNNYVECKGKRLRTFGGGAKTKIMGRLRKIYVIRGHRYIKTKGEYMLVSKAEKLDKAAEKHKNKHRAKLTILRAP